MICAGMLLAAACGETADDPSGGSGGSGGSAGSAGAAGAAGPQSLIASSRAVRLTNQQWENVVRDLFGWTAPTGLADELVEDAPLAGDVFGNTAQGLPVDQVHVDTYRSAAKAVADQVLADPATLARILPRAGPDDPTRARQLIESFGKRAYRRPLTEDEVDEYFGLYELAAADGFEAGVRLLLVAFLQSPNFLYRLELGTQEVGGAIALSGWELASRLSFTLWDSMPDEDLFAAAESGALATSEGVEQQARRMLQDARAASVVARFHAALFDVDAYESIYPPPAVFPNAPPNLGALAIEENQRFVSGLFSTGGGLRDVFLSTQTWVNADLAGIYGLSGSFGPDFVEVTLDATQRRGMFTQVGFLAATTTPMRPDPIARGMLLLDRVACVEMSVPPEQVMPLPEPEPGMTNREIVELVTEQPGSSCATCHATLINPYGFPFESYDAIGAVRTHDNGKPVDTSASPMIDDVPTPVADALELMDRLADSPGVHECYARRWLTYTFAREVSEAQDVVDHLSQDSRAGASFEELLVSLVTTRAFQNRSLEELP